MIRSHLDGIVAWTQTRRTNGFLEAINGLFQAAKRKARRVSGILCVRHNMAERSMYAKQEDNESGLGRGGANAVDPQRTH